MTNKKITPEYIKKHMKTGQIELPEMIKDEFGCLHNLDDDIKLADKEIEEKQLLKSDINITFRWSKKEIERCKKVACKKGLKYQAYMKSILKQAMDKEEGELGLT